MSTVDSLVDQPPPPVRAPRPTGLPERAVYLEQMLESTKRPGVPLRSTFVQQPRRADNEGNRGSTLAKLVKTRSAPTLDAYLLIHALASSRKPYEAWYPVASWVRALGLDTNTGGGEGDGLNAAKTQWSKLTSRLVDLKLVERRRSSNRIGYALLDESGSGEEYVRPTDHKDHGHWFTLPHVYWREDHYKNMDLATKAMLLIALSSNARFTLPADRVPQWYGMSVATARRGLRELERLGILQYDQAWRADPTSKTGWAEVRTYYLLGEWALDARKTAMREQRMAPTSNVAFTTELVTGDTDVAATSSQIDAGEAPVTAP